MTDTKSNHKKAKRGRIRSGVVASEKKISIARFFQTPEEVDEGEEEQLIFNLFPDATVAVTPRVWDIIKEEKRTMQEHFQAPALTELTQIVFFTFAKVQAMSEIALRLMAGHSTLPEDLAELTDMSKRTTILSTDEQNKVQFTFEGTDLVADLVYDGGESQWRFILATLSED